MRLTICLGLAVGTYYHDKYMPERMERQKKRRDALYSQFGPQPRFSKSRKSIIHNIIMYPHVYILKGVLLVCRPSFELSSGGRYHLSIKRLIAPGCQVSTISTLCLQLKFFHTIDMTKTGGAQRNGQNQRMCFSNLDTQCH